MAMTFMRLRALWERCRSHGRAHTVALPVLEKPRVVKAFQPLTHDETVAVLDDAIQWLIDETRTTLALPNSPAKLQRWAELRARDRCMARDFKRIMREQEG